MARCGLSFARGGYRIAIEMQDNATIVVTGGAGFIGSALVRRLIERTDTRVVNVDKLTYAGNLKSVEAVASSDRYRFEQIDICDSESVSDVFKRHHPTALVHLAAETHVDRSISAAAPFVTTNFLGTYTLLDAANKYWAQLERAAQNAFRFLHISTDEVFGSLGPSGQFSEDSLYEPSSPYAATKAGADHLVRAWQRTYGLPTVITNCSNNFGPYQHAEKLVPTLISNAVEGQPMPIYGDGGNVRDWLYVDDHAAALYRVLCDGAVGETYAVGANNERKNIDVAKAICAILDDRLPHNTPHADLITHVGDRPGHDRRYAIDARKIRDDLGWAPQESFESGLRKTVDWYLENSSWQAGGC